MKSTPILLLLVAIFALTSSIFNNLVAQQKGDNFGFGFMAGEPSGVSIKKWTSDNSAFDLGAAWSLAGTNEALHLHTDYLFHNWFADTPNLAFYYGIGIRTILDDQIKVGARIPMGLTYVFEHIPFDAFVEAVPVLDFVPDTKFAGNGAVGIRFYF